MSTYVSLQQAIISIKLFDYILFYGTEDISTCYRIIYILILSIIDCNLLNLTPFNQEYNNVCFSFIKNKHRLC